MVALGDATFVARRPAAMWSECWRRFAGIAVRQQRHAVRRRQPTAAPGDPGRCRQGAGGDVVVRGRGGRGHRRPRARRRRGEGKVGRHEAVQRARPADPKSSAYAGSRPLERSKSARPASTSTAMACRTRRCSPWTAPRWAGRRRALAAAAGRAPAGRGDREPDRTVVDLDVDTLSQPTAPSSTRGRPLLPGLATHLLWNAPPAHRRHRRAGAPSRLAARATPGARRR